MDAARMGRREEAEEVRLFAHMPAAVSRTETVRMPPALWVDGMLQGDFHAVCRLFSDDASHAVCQVALHHVSFVFQRVLQVLKLHAGACRKEGILLRSSQLAGDDTAHMESSAADVKCVVFQAQRPFFDDKLKTGNCNACHTTKQGMHFRAHAFVGCGCAISHGFAQFGIGDL